MTEQVSADQQSNSPGTSSEVGVVTSTTGAHGPAQKKFRTQSFMIRVQSDKDFNVKIFPKLKYAAWQFHKTSGKAIHWHAIIKFDNARFSTAIAKTLIKNYKGSSVNVQKLMGTYEQAIAYIEKEGTKIIEFGQKPAPGKKGTLNMEEVKDIAKSQGMKGLAEQYPELIMRHGAGLSKLVTALKEKPERKTMEVIVLYGEAGTGKSSYAKQIAGESVYQYTKVGGSQNSFWFDGYEDEKVLIIDDFTGSTMPHEAMLKIMGTDPFRVEGKGSSTWACWEKVIITSNFEPQQWYCKYWDMSPKATKDAFFRRIHKILHFKGINILTSDCIIPKVEKIKWEKPFKAKKDFLVVDNWNAKRPPPLDSEEDLNSPPPVWLDPESSSN